MRLTNKIWKCGAFTEVEVKSTELVKKLRDPNTCMSSHHVKSAFSKQWECVGSLRWELSSKRQKTVMAKIVHEAKSNVFNEQPPEVLNFIHSLI